MTGFTSIAAATLTKNLQSAIPFACGVAAGLLAGYCLTRFLDRKRRKKPERRR